jgi:hypothetical protein
VAQATGFVDGVDVKADQQDRSPQFKIQTRVQSTRMCPAGYGNAELFDVSILAAADCGFDAFV